MSQSADSNIVDDRIEEDPNNPSPDYTPVIVDDMDDDGAESENRRRRPIDIGAELLDAKELEDLLRPLNRPLGDKADDVGTDQTDDVSAAVQGEAAEQTAQREAELVAEIENQKNLHLRAVADLHNYRRRSEEEIRRIRSHANERLIKDILPLIDDLDRCIQAAQETESFEQLVGGVAAIYRKFEDMLGKEGVAAVPSIGETFNPDVHEAVMLDSESEESDGIITAELRKGYTMHGRLIRPALVTVSGS